MTTGSITIDNRKPVTTNCGTQLAGRYFSKSWVGEDDPGKHRKENAYQMSLTSIDYRISRWRWDEGDSWKTCVDNLASWELPPFTDNDLIKLAVKLGSKVRGHNFNPLVTLGEGKESLNMVLDAASRISSALINVRRGRFSKAFDALKLAKVRGVSSRKTLSSNWLELQYGWVPLLSDIKAGAEAFASLYNEERSVYTVNMTKQGRIYSDAGYTVNGGAWSKQRLKAIVRRNNTSAMTPSIVDPVLVAWELLPLSFVADWILPIGNYLEALDVAHSLEATYVTSVMTKKWGTVTGYPPPNQLDGTHPYGLFLTVNRSISQKLDVPTPNFKSLREAFTQRDIETGETVPFYKRVTDALALSVSVFRT